MTSIEDTSDSTESSMAGKPDNEKSKDVRSLSECQQDAAKDGTLSEKLLTRENTLQVWEIVKSLNKSELQQVSCEVVQHTCKLLDSSSVDQTSVSSAERIFVRLANVIDPKQCLILLIEQAREQWTDAKFQALLLPVLKTIRRTNAPLGHSLAFALDAFSEYLVALPLPNIQMDMEWKERLLLDADPCVRRVYDNVPRFLSFVRPFVNRVSWATGDRSADSGDISKQVNDLSRCILNVIGRPLGHLDLVITQGHAKSTARASAEHCLHLLNQLQPDFVRFVVAELSVIDQSTTPSEKAPKMVGLGTFSFLAFGENVCPDCIPRVYSRRFLLELNAPIVANLLEQAELIPRLHGVHLCINLLENIDHNSLPAELVESEDMRRLVLAAVKSTVTAKTKELSSSVLKVLTLIAGTLEPAGKLQYIYAMLKIAPRTGGLVSTITGLLTHEILANIDKAENNVFTGADLERALQLVFALPNGEKTDLLENSERIMAALKLLRLVLPRDKKLDNVTGIWNLIPLIENKYFRLLFAGIELSRSHYQLEIRKLRELRRGDPTGREFISHGTSVELSKHQQLGVLETAIHTFDMMEDVAKQVLGMIQSLQAEHTVAS